MISNDVLQLTKQRLREHLAAKETSSDPVKWVRYMLGEEYVSYAIMQEAQRAVMKHRQSMVVSVNASGKSYSMLAIMSLFWVDTHGPNSRVMCVQPSYSQSVRNLSYIAEISETIRERYEKGLIDHYIDGHVVSKVNYSINGQDVIFARNPVATRAAGVLKGAHSTGGTLIILDEADALSYEVIRASQNVLTGKRDRLVALTNPKDPQSFILQKFQEWRDTGKCDWHVTHISWFSLPGYTGEELASESQKTHLLSKEYVDEIINTYGADESVPEYSIYVLGIPAYESGLTMIRAADITMGINTEFPADYEQLPRPILGVDLAGLGVNGDDSVIYMAHSAEVEIEDEDEDGKPFIHKRTITRIRLLDALTKNDCTHQEQARWIIDKALGVDAKMVCFDCRNIGQVFDVELQDELRRRNCVGYIELIGMDGSAHHMYPNRYKNHRAWYLGNMADRLRAGEIDLDPKDEKLHNELMSIGYDLDSQDRIVLTPKKKMAKSPDYADAATYCAILDDNIEQMRNGGKSAQQVIYEETGLSDFVLFDDDPFMGYVDLDW